MIISCLYNRILNYEDMIWYYGYWYRWYEYELFEKMIFDCTGGNDYNHHGKMVTSVIGAIKKTLWLFV